MASADKRKILIVDDSEVVLEVTRVALESAGYLVVTHDRAAGCVALILQEKPDLVLMDVSMPHLSGDTIVGVLGRAQPRGDTIVLLYSSLPPDVLRLKAEAVGAQGFIRKTADTFGLVREVGRWVKRGTGSSSGRMATAADVSSTASSGRQRAARDLALLGSAQTPEQAMSNEEDSRSSSEQLMAATSPDGAAASGTIARAHPPAILLIDRDMAVLSKYRQYLQGDQLSVEYALSGSAALRRISANDPPDLAVCDAFMADFSGLELYRSALAIALSWRYRMILTADAKTPSSASVFAEFKGQLLAKPVSAEALRGAVRACVAQRSAGHAGRASAT